MALILGNPFCALDVHWSGSWSQTKSDVRTSKAGSLPIRGICGPFGRAIESTSTSLINGGGEANWMGIQRTKRTRERKNGWGRTGISCNMPPTLVQHLDTPASLFSFMPSSIPATQFSSHFSLFIQRVFSILSGGHSEIYWAMRFVGFQSRVCLSMFCWQQKLMANNKLATSSSWYWLLVTGYWLLVTDIPIYRYLQAMNFHPLATKCVKAPHNSLLPFCIFLYFCTSSTLATNQFWKCVFLFLWHLPLGTWHWPNPRESRAEKTFLLAAFGGKLDAPTPRECDWEWSFESSR